MSESERHRLATKQLAAYQPAWISVQFVSWSFGWKGIMGPTSWATLSLLKNRPLHVMFHETWVVGAPDGTRSALKRFAWSGLGALQKKSIQWFFARARPDLVHTSNAVYRTQLADVGIAASQLPMFGSIEASESNDWHAVRDLAITRAGVDLGPDREKLLLVGVFGTLRPCPIAPAFEAIFSAAERRRVVILSLGGMGPAGAGIIEDWRRCNPRLEVIKVGRLDQNLLSLCFNHLDVAIALHRPELLGKSSAVAAMLEHGVPVIALPWGPPPAADDIFHKRWKDLIWPADRRIIQLLRTGAKKHHWLGAQDGAAEQLLAEMEKAMLQRHAA